jgi:NitT/TauT family transport system permease protein
MLAKARKHLSSVLWPSAVAIILLAFWEAAVRLLHVRSILLPPPSEIVSTIFSQHSLLATHLWPSLYLTVVSFALSAIGGILVAVLITYSTILRKGFYPVIVVSQVIPKIAIAPLFIVWFGTGATSGVLLAVLIAFFPMTINAALGFQSIDDDIDRMARAFMASRWQMFWKIRMPIALPYIFGGMKISITLAIIGVIVSEFVASQQGIGYLIKLSGGLLDTPLMMAAITVLSLSGLALYGLIALAERRAIYWQESAGVLGS